MREPHPSEETLDRMRQRVKEMYASIPSGLLASQELIWERRIEAFRENVEMGIPLEEAEALFEEAIAMRRKDFGLEA